MFHMDVVGGATSSLCIAYENVIRRPGSEARDMGSPERRTPDRRTTAEQRTRSQSDVRRVELLFDHEAEGLEVRSPYGNDGVLKLRATELGRIMVRVPAWVPHGPIQVNGVPQEPKNGYVEIDQPPIGEWIRITFPLVERSMVLHHRTHDIRVRLRGDEVTAMENFGADLTFFDSWE